VGPAAAGPSPPNYSIPDGEWEGVMAASYLWEAGGGQVSGTWNWGGTMDFTSAAGEVAGEAVIDGIGTSKVDLGGAEGNVHALVAIFGPAEEPAFQAQTGLLEVFVSVAGFENKLTFPIDASTSHVVPVQLFAVSCSQIEGHWDAFMNDWAAANSFGLENLTTNFHAVRTGDLPPEAANLYAEEMQELQSRANEFLSETKASSLLNVNELEDLLEDAEALSQALQQNSSCGFTQEWSFLLPLAGIVAQLVDFAVQNPGAFNGYELWLLVNAAVRTGLIGAGAVNPELAEETKAQLNDLLLDQLIALDEASGTDKCTALTPLYIASLTIGGGAKVMSQSLLEKYSCW
jgi:hypothetical protein